jgi:pyridoxamine 5'-phosphate oxidase
MALATVGEGSRPAARMVLLQHVDARGLVFYTNTRSRKGREIAAHADVSLLFHWDPLGVQVRFDGRASPASPEEADAYFATRPRGSQIGAWASAQSEEIGSREELTARVETLERELAGRPVPRPAHWSGYRVTPFAIEFWREGEFRLHHRELYTREREGGPWSVALLQP